MDKITDADAGFYGRATARLLRRVKQLELDNAKLRDFADKMRNTLLTEASQLETRATYWTPGSTVAGRNPYAHQMHSALRHSAVRLRQASDQNNETDTKPVASQPKSNGA